MTVSVIGRATLYDSHELYTFYVVSTDLSFAQLGVPALVNDLFFSLIIFVMFISICFLG